MVPNLLYIWLMILVSQVQDCIRFRGKIEHLQMMFTMNKKRGEKVWEASGISSLFLYYVPSQESSTRFAGTSLVY